MKWQSFWTLRKRIPPLGSPSLHEKKKKNTQKMSYIHELLLSKEHRFSVYFSTAVAAKVGGKVADLALSADKAKTT